MTKDYDGFDTASNLDRVGIYRLNISVARREFEDIVGYPPAAHAEHHAEFDYAALDQVLPHPVYATQAWVSVLTPGDATSAQARSLITEAHARAAARRPQR